MTIYDVLKDDHEEVDELLEKLARTTTRSAGRRRHLFEHLRGKLLAHSEAEEEHFYRRLRESSSTRERVLEAHEEHRVVERLLAEMAALAPANEAWGAKLSLLTDVVRRHVEVEEGELFRLARRVLDRAEAVSLGELLRANERRLLTARK